MKAVVDAEVCVGCALCPDTCPDVFKMEREVAVVKVKVVPLQAEATCHKVVENCPVTAISIEE